MLKTDDMTEQTQQPKLFDRVDILLATLAGVLALALYVRTLASGVLPGDSGEFQVLAYQVGITHNTGYPVYILLAKLFITLVPAGSVAYRVNLFSAFMGALAVGGVYLSAKVLSRSTWAALVGALALTVSYTLWSQAVIAEIYTPAAAFLSAVWLLVLAWYKTGSKRALFAAGLCGGLGLGIHSNLSIVAPAVGIFLLLNWKRWRELWRPALLGALLGTACYLVAFFAIDLHAPPANVFNASYGPARSAWGLSEADIASPVKRVWANMSAMQWRIRMFPDPQTDTPKNAGKYVDGLGREFSPWLVFLAAAGLIVLFIRDWRVGVLFVIALVVHWFFYFNYRVSDQYVFFIPSYMWLAMLAAIALGGVSWVVGRLLPSRAAQVAVNTGLMLAVLYIGVLPLLTSRWKAVRQSNIPFIGDEHYVVDKSFKASYQQVRQIVTDLEPNAIVFEGWRLLWPYWYAAQIEQSRSDLRFIEQYPIHETPGLPASTVEFIRANLAQHPIYLAAYQAEVVQAGLRLDPVTIDDEQFFKVERP
jgi:4-amino-4-deoxy-L-arabinose transferase-like glycosyltransferase